jgi:hypothetical protein
VHGAYGNTTKLGTDAHGLLGPTGGLRPEAMLLTLHPELGHLAFNDAGIGTQAPRRKDMPWVEYISERLAAQAL